MSALLVTAGRRPGVYEFVDGEHLYTWDTRGPAGNRFTRVNGTPVTDPDEVAGFLDHVGTIRGRDAVHLDVQHIVLRHLAYVTAPESIGELFDLFCGFLTTPDALFSVLDTSEVTDVDLRCAADANDLTVALLRSAISHRQLHILNCHHLVEFATLTCQNQDMTIAQACDAVVLSLLLMNPFGYVTDPTDQWLTDLMDLGRAARIVDANFTQGLTLVDDAHIVLTGNPAPIRPVMVDGDTWTPAPAGLAPLLGVGAVLLAMGTRSRGDVVEAMGVVASVRPMARWRDDPLTPELVDRMLTLSGQYKAWQDMQMTVTVEMMQRSLWHAVQLPDDLPLEAWATMVAAITMGVGSGLDDTAMTQFVQTALMCGQFDGEQLLDVLGYFVLQNLDPGERP